MITRRKLSIALFISVLLLSTQTSFSQQQTTEHTPDSISVYSIVDQMPTFPGGENELMQFLSKNIVYPIVAYEQCIQGRVIVRFVVDVDGSVRDAEVMRSVNSLLDAEALRVIKTMPKWNPGEKDGKAIPVYFILPIIFKAIDCAEDQTQTQKKSQVPIEMELVDDTTHPDKTKLLGSWAYQPESVKLDYKFVNDEYEKLYAKDFSEWISTMIAMKKASLLGAVFLFGSDNIVIVNNKEADTEEIISDTGIYKLQENLLWMHLPMSQDGTQRLTYELTDSVLVLKLINRSEAIEGYLEFTLNKIK